MRYFRLVLCASIMLLVAAVASGQQDYINNFAGGGPNNVPALQANLEYPGTTATDSAGNYYIVSYYQERVFKVSPSGTLTVLAGNGFYGYGGDGGPATQAELYLSNSSQVAVDSSLNVYIADTNNCVVRVVNQSTGIISTFAGTPNYCSFGGDTGPATSAYLYYPYGLAADAAGNVYISDAGYFHIRQVNTSGIINTVAGNGSFCYGYSNSPCGDGGPATSAELGYVYSLAVDGAGNVFLADNYYYNENVRLFTPGGNINTVAGAYYGAGPGVSPCNQYGGATCGDGGPATSAGFNYPYGIASDASGNLFIADYYNYDIREVVCADIGAACTPRTGTTSGYVYTVAGMGGYPGDSGDGGPSTSATLGYAGGVAVDSSDDMFIPDYYHYVVREAALGGNINTVAGNGTLNYTGNGIPATNSVLNGPFGVAFDPSGNAYIADRYNCIVRKVDTTGTITLFAGTPGSCGFGGDGGSATASGVALLNNPLSVAADSAGNVYIADYYNCRIRVVDTSGNINTFAGEYCGYNGDGPATSQYLYYPEAVTTDAAGNVYIADSDNSIVRKVSGGNMTTIAGIPDTYGYSGDGGPATSAKLYYPVGVAVDKAGNVYISDEYNLRIRQINPAGIIDTFAGNGAGGFQGDGGPAVQTSLSYPQEVAVDPAGDVLIADTSNQRIRLVDGLGLIHTVAGTGSAGYSGPEQDVLATTAELYSPYGVGVDASGNIYIGDTSNGLVRKVNAMPALNASRTNLVFDVQPVGTKSGAQTLTLTAGGPLTISSITSSGAPFTETDDCYSGPPSGESCNMDVFFAPTASGTVTGTITITDNGFFNPSLVINLTGAGTAVAVAPNPLSFAAALVGSTSAAKAVKVTNKSKTNALVMGTVTVSGDFLVSANTCTGSIPSLASCTISVEFKPTQNGARTGTLLINDSDGSSPQIVSLSGTGIGVTLLPATTTFAAEPDGTTSAPKTITLTNLTTSPMSITTPGAIGGTNATDFSITGGTCVGLNPVPGSSNCTYTVAFTASAVGAETATLSVSDSYGTGTQTATLKGTGIGVALLPATTTFANEPDGTTSPAKTITFYNYNAAPLSITTAGAIGGTNATDFAITGGTCVGLNPVPASSNCTYTVTFTASAVGAETATLSVTDSDGTQTVTLKGTGIGVALLPATTTLANEPDGTTSPAKTITLFNYNAAPMSIISPGAIGGTNMADFSITGGTCIGLNPVPGSSNCTYTVTFTPSLVGAETATLSVTDSDGTQTVTLKGTGIGVALLPATTTFAAQKVGTTSPAKTITLFNYNAAPMSITTPGAIGGANAGDFSITGGTCVGLNPVPGSSNCTYTVTFKPSLVGAETATLSVTDSDGTQTVTLKGTGK